MGKIVKVSGPLVVATGLQEANMADVVRVGEQGLIGEVLTMSMRRLPAWVPGRRWSPPATPCPWNWSPA